MLCSLLNLYTNFLLYIYFISCALMVLTSLELDRESKKNISVSTFTCIFGSYFLLLNISVPWSEIIERREGKKRRTSIKIVFLNIPETDVTLAVIIFSFKDSKTSQILTIASLAWLHVKLTNRVFSPMDETLSWKYISTDIYLKCSNITNELFEIPRERFVLYLKNCGISPLFRTYLMNFYGITSGLSVIRNVVISCFLGC